LSDHTATATDLDHEQGLQHQFDDLKQQYDATTFGMWVFLAQEILFFGGLFAGYTVYRSMYPEAFFAASHTLDRIVGGFNTIVLIVSSLTMALAVRAAQLGQKKALINNLLATAALGMAFLGVKVYEYGHKWHDGLVPGLNFTHTGPHAQQMEIMLSFYFAMTGMHALHMIIGEGLLAYFIWKAYKNAYTPSYYGPVEIMGLYWHFVDIVWIFLFPLLYLIE
jgi:cytochrome c oxidase subunit 3